jgi:hypothetical protein
MSRAQMHAVEHDQNPLFMALWMQNGTGAAVITLGVLPKHYLTFVVSA